MSVPVCPRNSLPDGLRICSVSPAEPCSVGAVAGRPCPDDRAAPLPGAFSPSGCMATAGVSAGLSDVRCRLSGELPPTPEGLARNWLRGGNASSPALDAVRLRAVKPTGVSGPLRDSGRDCGDAASAAWDNGGRRADNGDERAPVRAFMESRVMSLGWAPVCAGTGISARGHREAAPRHAKQQAPAPVASIPSYARERFRPAACFRAPFNNASHHLSTTYGRATPCRSPSSCSSS